MSKFNAVLLLAAIVVVIIMMRSKNEPAPVRPPIARPSPQKTPAISQTQKLQPAAPTVPIAEPAPEVVTDTTEQEQEPNRPKRKKRFTLPFRMLDGLAVVQGDNVLGKPSGEVNPDSPGEIIIPPVKKWPTRVIPYWIQPSVINPDRVKAALALFDRTTIHFVEHTDQTEGIVFEDGPDICKSYVGHVGGLQPIWIPRECGPTEIAHEIMHALGFIHEQNRTDRDDYITVLMDNVEDKYKENFEKLPQEFMLLSGLSQFDFESVMMYSTDLFAKGGQSTMESKFHDRPIHPGETLSTSDVQRINSAYGL